MWTGTYTKWNPIPAYAGKRFEVDAVYDDREGFRIWFRPHDDTKPMLIVKFEFPLLYSSSDEGDRLSGISTIQDFPHLFWKVDGSGLITEFKRQTAGGRDNDSITHYCFMSCNQCLDVLSITIPSFIGLPDN